MLLDVAGICYYDFVAIKISSSISSKSFDDVELFSDNSVSCLASISYVTTGCLITFFFLVAKFLLDRFRSLVASDLDLHIKWLD